MTIMSPSIEGISGPPRASDSVVRALIARHLDVDIGRVTDDASFIDDLGADWLDRLELNCDRRPFPWAGDPRGGCGPDPSCRRSNPLHRIVASNASSNDRAPGVLSTGNAR